MSKFEDIIESIKSAECGEDSAKAKLQAFLSRKKAKEIIEEVEEERKIKIWVIILAIIGVIAIGAVVGILLYRKNKPDYLDDFDDEVEDEDDDIFEEE